MTKITLPFIIGIFFLFVIPASGQVNTEKLRQGLDKDGYSATVEFSYSITKGNSDLVQFGLAPGFVWRQSRHQTFMINELETASANGGDLVNKGFSHLRYNYQLNRIWVYELFSQAQYDKSQDLKARYLAGSGIRIRLVQKEASQLAVGITAMYEYEELDTGDLIRIIRGSNYLSFRAAKKNRIAASATVYVQPKYADFHDIRVLGEAALGVSVSTHLSVTNTLTYRYDSEPPIGIKEYDLKIKGGLGLAF